mmetsp:Transcript_56669/g.94050  ORF Transcript_56669/g.94050 Transcript_56669/m.94050 type:complete len:115 (-) Transcript_56669:957-1301(-)
MTLTFGELQHPQQRQQEANKTDATNSTVQFPVQSSKNSSTIPSKSSIKNCVHYFDFVGSCGAVVPNTDHVMPWSPVVSVSSATMLTPCHSAPPWLSGFCLNWRGMFFVAVFQLR